MAVIVKYVVERNGKEIMTFASKKEADAYDRQLDIAEQLQALLETAGSGVDAATLGELALFIAKHREPITQILKGGKLDMAAVPVESAKPMKKAADKTRKARAEEAVA